MSYLDRLTQLETHQSPTDETDKNTSVGFVSSLPVHIETERTAENDDTVGKATDDPLPDPAMEGRRQKVLAMLNARPGTRYAALVDDPNADPVIVSIGIRDAGTCELAIPAANYDAFALLAVIERHTTGATLQ